jgi:hypothetical protein
MALVRALHGRRPWSEFELHGRPCGSSSERGERWKGRGRKGCGWGCGLGVAPWGGVKELDHAAPFSLCVEMLHHEEEKKKREKRKRRKERERRRGRKKKRKMHIFFQIKKLLGEIKYNLWDWAKILFSEKKEIGQIIIK